MKNHYSKLRTVLSLLVILMTFLTAHLQAQVVHPVASRNEAKFTVAIVPHESYADLKVYRTDSLNSNVLKNTGYWIISESMDKQTVPIFWLSDPITADLKIVLVNYPERAGWINKSKRSLLKPQG
ncbi:MAG TPA: DUF6150 family protein [Sediminibacterium sp.]|nr:DUF6150 family protein [Sediminibacterium sp.]HQS55091.1 DUF6150 family protein [Sediminibacterium sp.]